MRYCCSSFNAKNIYRLRPDNYAERILLSGFCPHCNSWVIELKKKTFSGYWTSITAKRKKAMKLYNECLPDIISEYLAIKQGNKTNMAFKYGLNVETEKGIKQYSVDFNGNKQLIKKIP